MSEKLEQIVDNIPDGFVEENGHIVMSDERMDLAFRRATEQAVENLLLKGSPVAKWDNDVSRVYLLYPDGRKEYV